jgi:hypothetical protein
VLEQISRIAKRRGASLPAALHMPRGSQYAAGSVH